MCRDGYSEQVNFLAIGMPPLFLNVMMESFKLNPVSPVHYK